MKRFGEVIKVKPEKFEEYKNFITRSGRALSRNKKKQICRILQFFYRDGYLFKYFEYVGDNYEEDMKKLAADEENKDGLHLQIRVRNRSKQQENRSGGLRWKTFFIFYKKEGIRL